MYPTLVVWGVPIRFSPIGLTPSGGTSGHLGGWRCQRVGVSAKNVLDPVESLFLLPEGVEDVLIMSMSTGMISGGLFE